MQCPNDKHNFIQADVYTGGTLYRCDKCGLEAHAPMLSGMIFKEYFGSYIGGISHKWIPSDMRAEDKNKLHECLRSLDFDSFTTSPDLFRNFEAAGFCISNRFLRRFSNGKGFECLSPRCDGFNTLVEVVKNIVGMKPEPVCGEALCDN